MAQFSPRSSDELRSALLSATWGYTYRGKGSGMIVTALVCPLCAALVAVADGVQGYDPRTMHVDFHVSIIDLIEQVAKE